MELWKIMRDRWNEEKANGHKKTGRRPKYKTAQELWEACLGYFEWLDENPIRSAQLVTYMGDSYVTEVPKMRAATISGLSVWLGISVKTWYAWRNAEEPDDEGFHLRNIVHVVDEMMREQKLTGAAAGVLKENVIIRDLGLKEQSAHEISSPGGGAVQFELVAGEDEDDEDDA